MAVAGGVLLSTVVSFYFTPPVFALLARRGKLLSTRPEPDDGPKALVPESRTAITWRPAIEAKS